MASTLSPSSVIICWSLCWWVSSSSRHTGVLRSHLLFYVIIWKGKAKLIKTAAVYFIRLKVPTRREEIGDPLDKCSVNRDISPS